MVGFQVGSRGVRERFADGVAKTAACWNRVEIFQEMWHRVGRETGTEWVSGRVGRT